jgi:hypothetical protein
MVTKYSKLIKKLSKLLKIKKMTVKLSSMDIKYITHFPPPKKYQNWGYWYENIPSGYPGSNAELKVAE